jgi:selenocysteine-specific elongation factor
MILGTAGHIDHGKTSLVRALTGVDTDRLPEEKRRGITIELGFAPLVLDGIGTIGIVDVPGHEAFVRTMVAGATGIDLALVVVAADEGVMPQTREHLAILELLGVQRGVIALTKADLVEDEWLALVEDDARTAARRALPNAAVVATSVETGRGIDELRAAIARAARTVEARRDVDLFRLPVDRAFVVKGTGTVVTGTVWSGEVRRDDTLRVLPGDRTARVRGIQGHGEQLDAVASGARAALALAGVDVADVARGETLVGDRDWRPTMIARADVTLVPEVGVDLKPRAWLRFHVGTSEVGARVVARAGEVSRDARFAARLVFDAPVVLRAGDRFVLRATAPLNTVAGGVVTDPYAPRRARPWAAGLSAGQRLLQIVGEAGVHGVELVSLPVRLGETPASCRAIVDSVSDRVVVVGARLLDRATVESLIDSILRAVDAFHADHPLELGLPTQTARAALRAGADVADFAIQSAVASGALTASSGFLARCDFAPALGAQQAGIADHVLARLGAAGVEPPTTDELGAEIGAPGDIASIARFLERRGDIIQVEATRYYSTPHLQSLVERLRSVMAGGVELSPSELRDALGLSRKFLIPFLEYCDRAGYTNRGSSGRVWRGAKPL